MSHEVQIIRRETKSHLPVPVTANSKKVLASVYVGQGPLKGLDGEKEKELLSSYLGVDREEKDFPKITRSFWADLRVEIPSEGKVLNISTRDEDGENPLNPGDYIIYKWAQKHPYVAPNKKEMLDNSKYQFYIHDPEIEVGHENQKIQFKKKAYEQFILMGDDDEKLDFVIRLLTDSDPNQLSVKQKQNYVDTIIEDNPKQFYVTATDKHLQTKALVAELVSANIINKIGNQHYFIDEKLGDTIDDTVKYFNDKKNSQTVNTLKAKLEEFKRGKVPQSNKTTKINDDSGISHRG